jgi:hypothetical protein
MNLCTRKLLGKMIGLLLFTAPWTFAHRFTNFFSPFHQFAITTPWAGENRFTNSFLRDEQIFSPAHGLVFVAWWCGERSSVVR